VIRTNKAKIAQFSALLMSTLVAPSLSVAQTIRDDGSAPSAASLNLPSTISVLGKNDATIRKATAIVNGEIVTGTDIDHRLALIVLANGGKIAPEEMARLRLQIVRNLIDETLQIQEAKANKIELNDDDVDQSFLRVSKNFKRTPVQMIAYLKTVGSSANSLKRQIKGELAWSRLLRRKVEPYVNVSQEEVDGIVAKLVASKGKREYRVSELYMSATAETANEVQANERKILEQLKAGGSFAAYARQFSESSTASVGGDLGWVRAEQLPDPLAQTVQSMTIGQIAGPLPIAGGFDVLYLADSRAILTADPRDSTMSLRQISIPFAAGMTPEAAKTKATEFGVATQAMQGCGKVKEVAAKFGGEVVDSDAVKVRDLPAQLQELLLKLQIGQSTPPFGSVKDGIRVLVLCGRDEAQAAAAPNADEIKNGMTDQRVNIRAQRYLRDLRRDAIIEYR
jgi:peptidyl-prolyl cis-trans isomerase SurA